ncbi:metal ion transporter [Acrasis kona]|uniref:Metal ion transporter n=1 Tax=Acrasis kona TaxID=1008807 RepID=A0AAW2ZRY1_9EUKA
MSTTGSGNEDDEALINNNSLHSDSEPTIEIPSTINKRLDSINLSVPRTTSDATLVDSFESKSPTITEEDDDETLLDLMYPDLKNLTVNEKDDNKGTISDLLREEIDSLQLDVVPAIGTNIEDIFNQMELIEEGATQCLIFGLGYECRSFTTIKSLWSYIKNTYRSRSKEEEDNDFDADDDENMHSLQHSQDENAIEPVWVDIQNPSAEDMKLIQKFFNLHPLTTEDCTNNDTGEKWEFFESYMFVVFTGQTAGNADTPTQLNIIVFDEYVITIHEKPIKGLDLVMKRIGKEFETVMHPQTHHTITHSISQPNLSGKRNRRHKQMMTLTLEPNINNEERKRTVVPSADWVLYAYLDAMVDIYIPHVDSLVQEVENLDEMVFMLDESEHDDLLRRIGFTKKNIVNLRRLLFPKQKMTTYLVSQDLQFLSKTIQVYMRDVLDHLANAIDKLESAKENLNHTHSNYLTKVQIDIAEASMRTDDFLNRMTVIAALFVPLTLVSGIWGMNVYVPGQESETLEWFFGIVCALVIFSLVVIIYLRKRLVNL